MRNQKTRIIIAERDPDIFNVYIEIIQRFKSDFEIVDVVHTGSELLSLTEKNPINIDIIISESCLPDMSIIEFHKKAKALFHFNYSYIITGNRVFDHCYQAIKLDAIDYLIKPVSPEDLRRSLEKATLSRINSIDRARLSQSFYIEDGRIETLYKHSQPLEEINSMYNTNFCVGLFQMIFVKLDYPKSLKLEIDYSSMVDLIKEQIIISFRDIYSDLILEQKDDGIMALLNYTDENQSEVMFRIQNIFKDVRKIINPNTNINISVCVSSAINDPCKVLKIKEQVRDVEWARMCNGLNKVVFWNSLNNCCSADCQPMFNMMLSDTKTALRTLDISAFRKLLIKFYSLPKETLVCHEARIFLKKILGLFFELYKDTIAEFTDPTLLYEGISKSSHLCTTFSEHQKHMTSQCVELMNNISDQLNNKMSHLIKHAIFMINENIDKKVTLEDIVAEVHLNKSYFSYLFKKETGQNFKQYVMEQKNNVACKLLKSTSLNISEISYSIGTSSVRTFSKSFKAINGMTPSEYRQRHSNIE